MNLSNSSLYVCEHFPPGSLRRAFDQIKKGQKGNTWTRKIEQSVRHKSGTAFTKVITQNDLDLIERLDNEFPEIRFHFSGPKKSEWVYIAPHWFYEDIIEVRVLADELDRVMEIQSAFSAALGVKSKTKDEITKERGWNISNSSTANGDNVTIPVERETSRSISEPNAEQLLSDEVKEGPDLNSVSYPERITLMWLWNHVPVSFWLWFIALLTASFIAGFAVCRIPWIAEIVE